MSAKKNKQMAIRTYILHHPSDTVQEIIEATGASRRMVFYVKGKLREEGVIPASRRDDQPLEETKSNEIVLDDQTLQTLAKSDNIEEEIGSEDVTRNRLLLEVQKIAFNASAHPDTRLSAIQIWAKLKDIAKAKDVGPGTPKTEEEVISRLVMLFKAVGPKMVLKAVQTAFGKENPDEKKETEQTIPSSGTQETPNTP